MSHIKNALLGDYEFHDEADGSISAVPTFRATRRTIVSLTGMSDEEFLQRLSAYRNDGLPAVRALQLTREDAGITFMQRLSIARERMREDEDQ